MATYDRGGYFWGATSIPTPRWFDNNYGQYRGLRHPIERVWNLCRRLGIVRLRPFDDRA